MKILNRAEILAAQDLKTETVNVPEWGGAVILQGGTGEERDTFEESIMVGKGQNRDVNTKRLRVKLLAKSIVDAAGSKLFSESDIEALSRKSAVVIERLFKVAQRLWGLSKEDVDSLVGESKAGPSSMLGSGSPGNGAALAASSSAV